MFLTLTEIGVEIALFRVWLRSPQNIKQTANYDVDGLLEIVA
ncbi:hypothetical protein [Oxynema aestuarii]|nr:hypothetical protein [Oxynema aestuarii]